MTRRPTAIICDDRPELAHLAELWLEGAGVEPVGTTSHMTDTDALCRALTPDLVLIDDQLEGESGIQALPELRRAAPDALIVVWTVDPEARPAALAAGADACLAKDDFDGLDRVAALVADRHRCN